MLAVQNCPPNNFRVCDVPQVARQKINFSKYIPNIFRRSSFSGLKKIFFPYYKKP